MRLVQTRPWRALAAAAGVLTALALPASASALTFHIVNESGKPASEVFVDITGAAALGSGFSPDSPVPLSSIPGGEVTINRLIAGRVFISYGSPVRQVGGSAQESTTVETSPTRFDWAELTVHDTETEPVASESDVANLTAVEQFAIGMRLTTLGAGGEELESVGSTYANTLFAALQAIPGGPESTKRAPDGEILRVLSPDNKVSAYPTLDEYVHSMVGETITLHTAYFSKPFTTSVYSGEFKSDGTLELTGTERFEENGEVKERAATPTQFDDQSLIEEIYTGGETPNNLVGAVRRDVLAGFSLGLWGGKYGNDAINFCTNPNTTSQGTWCPDGFNVPAYAEARTTPAPFPAFEGYTSVIDQYTNIYGNPYNDASKRVQVALHPAKTLQLTILPDSPPSSGGNSSGGGGGGPSSSPSSSSAPSTMAAPGPPLSQAKFKLAKAAKFKHGKLQIGSVQCKGACGRIVALLSPVKGKGLIASEAVTARKPKAVIVLKPTKAGKKLLDAGKAKRAELTVTVTQPGHAPAFQESALRITG
jgi:hypothetical protein